MAMGLGVSSAVVYCKHRGCQPLDVYLDDVDVVHHLSPQVSTKIREMKKDIIKLLANGVILYDLKLFSNYVRDIRLNEKQISAFHYRSIVFCCLLKSFYYSLLASDESANPNVLIMAGIGYFLSNENSYWFAEETTKTVWNKLLQGMRATGSGAKKVVAWIQQKINGNEGFVEQIV